MSPKPVLAEFLRALRQKAGLSQAEVGKKLGYNAQFISNWESGRSSPPMPQILRLAEIYNVTAEEIYDVLVEDSLERTREKLELEFRKLRKAR